MGDEEMGKPGESLEDEEGGMNVLSVELGLLHHTPAPSASPAPSALIC